ncbi:MAG: UDP-4-amino-4,6-dideoxy-N-acetyl-beta-L-altrosamine transaminase [Deltaproteobacteria bacterium RBG_13_58_19]|nr:MAG: UDP-4-amino-4,6-dideoxy-N-acetyl-beta-L-altrosamine transaminase [Deltaproteobacteria bacterium RBG_13_58_19]
MKEKPTPTYIPYARQLLDDADVAAVVQTLRSGWLTCGPQVEAFEAAIAEITGASQAVAVSSGTAALHAAMQALDIGPGDEVILPSLTFAATANAVVYQGGTPVFADIDPSNLLLNPLTAAAKITPRTKAIIAVDYAGQPCDYEALRLIAQRYDLALVADACHSLGARYQGKPVGSWADLTVFSFHPAKHITTGEGGMVVTSHQDLAARMRRFRNHGISTDFRERASRNTWHYEMVDLGYNYRLSDLQCALGLSQLKKLPQWLKQRQAIAQRYNEVFLQIPEIIVPRLRPQVTHAYHLYVIMLRLDRLRASRQEIFQALRAAGIGVNVHYLPVHLHPFYQQHFHTGPGDCPAAEWCYERLLTLPLFPALSSSEVDTVIRAVINTLEQHQQFSEEFYQDLPAAYLH